jgi:hypothetical protein
LPKTITVLDINITLPKTLVEIFNRKQSLFSSFIFLRVKRKSLTFEWHQQILQAKALQHASHRAIQQHGIFHFANPRWKLGRFSFD